MKKNQAFEALIPKQKEPKALTVYDSKIQFRLFSHVFCLSLNVIKPRSRP